MYKVKEEKNKGITLISLVLSIIILLILARSFIIISSRRNRNCRTSFENEECNRNSRATREN